MPTGKDWHLHFQHLTPRRIARMRGAVKILLDDSMFKEHYAEFHRLDYFLRKVQEERREGK